MGKARTVFQIRLEVRDITPPIWRRLIVDPPTTIKELHYLIQLTMGWLDYHLHLLRAGDEEYGPPSLNEDRIGEPVKSERPGINRLLSQEKQEIVYEYDFGDGWEVSVTLEKVLPFDESLTPPVCIDGERNGPLEDSGGPLGYQDKLRLLANPSLPDPDGIREWIPPGFDPEFFDKDAINAQIDEEFL